MDEIDEIDDILKKGSTSPKSTKFGQEEKKKAIISIIIMLIVTFILWDYRTLNIIHLGFLSYILYPIKMFTVFLHEISHGLMAVLNGGHITKIHFEPAIGGFCEYKITPTFIKNILIASAGYLGSIFWGCVILYTSIRKHWDKAINIFIGIIMILVTILFARDLFSIIFTSLFGGFMFLSGTKFSDKVNEIILRYIGVVSCLYAFFDIPEDLIFRTVGNDPVQGSSDSFVIAQSMGMPFLSVPIGILWLILSALALYFTLKITFKVEKNN